MMRLLEDTMSNNRLQQLQDAGQSIWLDSIDRTMLTDGQLARRIRDDALTGMTSNPTIFEKALGVGTAYDAQLATAPSTLTPWELFELIETQDVRTACDLLLPVYQHTDGADGFASIEVSPGVAHDVEGTIVEARRLWNTVGRPNVMVKVPGTSEGARATRRLIAEGINVNITLLFSLDAHGSVIEAYSAGLEDRIRNGGTVRGISSVASFFVSRVDVEIDQRLDALAASASSTDAGHIRALKGRAAIANAKLAYALFRERFAGPRWETLRAQGARVQRPLWASTGTKNPAYRDVMYVEGLIGPNTVNTMPPATIEAFRDHGQVARTVDADPAGADRVLREVERAGVSLGEVTDKLLVDGLASFATSFASLLRGLERKTRRVTSATA
ncbi:MAG: transaldolase [Gemmatimonadaceae bacterium]